jgi:hypothetical protein
LSGGLERVSAMGKRIRRTESLKARSRRTHARSSSRVCSTASRTEIGCIGRRMGWLVRVSAMGKRIRRTDSRTTKSNNPRRLVPPSVLYRITHGDRMHRNGEVVGASERDGEEDSQN